MSESKKTSFAGKKTAEGFFELSARMSLPNTSELRVIDVRETDEFSGELGHLEGAESVPAATVQAAAGSWDREEPLLVVCRSGRRSAAVAALLVRMGFSEVASLVGGMMVVRGVMN